MAAQVTYPPLDELKPVVDGIWIVDSGPHHVMRMPMPVRMSIIRLGSGDLMLHSPTRYTAALRQQMETVGRIRHIVAPNIAHWSYVRDWQRECPGAITWAAPGLRDRWRVRWSGLPLDLDLSARPPQDWVDEIE